MINNVVLVGRLTADPELRTTTSGLNVTRFTLAVDRNYAKQGEERQTDFIRCIAWRNQADFISRFFHKGSMIAITGSIQTGSYDDKNGNKVYTTDIAIDKASFCESKKSADGETKSDANVNVGYEEQKSSDFEEIPDEEDLPF